MDGRPRYAELRDYVRVLRQQRLLILAVAALFSGVAYALAVRQDDSFAAQTSLAVRDVTQTFSLLGETPSASLPPERLAAIVAQDVTSFEVATAVIEREEIGRGRNVGELRSKVSASVDPATNLVRVTAVDGDPRTAAQIANAFSRRTVVQRRAQEVERVQMTLEAAEDEVRAARRQVRNEVVGSDIRLGIALQRRAQVETLASSIDPVSIVDAADVPGSPVSPRPVRDAILGLVLGLTLGLVLAFARDTLDRRLRTPQQVQDAVDLPVLGRVSDASLGTAGLFTKSDKRKVDPIDLEAFRIIRTNLDFLVKGTVPQVVLVTSGLPEEGKSTVAASLAAAAATTGRRSLLVECDLRRPSLAARFGEIGVPGLTDLMSGRSDRPHATRRLEINAPDRAPDAVASGGGQDPLPFVSDGPVLDVILAGTFDPRPAELLGSARFIRLLAELRGDYDTIVIDTNPMLSVVDPLELVPHVDAVILCVRARKTTRDQATAARAALERLPEKPAALVVTGVDIKEEGYGYYYAQK